MNKFQKFARNTKETIPPIRQHCINQWKTELINKDLLQPIVSYEIAIINEHSSQLLSHLNASRTTVAVYYSQENDTNTYIQAQVYISYTGKRTVPMQFYP